MNRAATIDDATELERGLRVFTNLLWSIAIYLSWVTVALCIQP